MDTEPSERLKAVLRRAQALLPDLQDCMIAGGIASIGYGTSLIHQPAAWIAVGVLLLALALWARR